jgi:hypothetical protein
MFLVMAVQSKADIKMLGAPTPVDLKFASGMVGVLPVFMSRKAAERYSKKKFTIVEIGEKKDAM